MAEPRIVWAADAATMAARHISEVRTGLACNCVCPGCQARLEAVNAENPLWKRRPHFRHYQAAELDDCAQQAVLKGARQMLGAITEIELPARRVERMVSAQDKLEFVGAATEPPLRAAVEAVEFVDATDAVLTLAGGVQIYVRLVATCRRPADVKQTQLSEIAIDVSDPFLRTADPDALRQHITLGTRAKHWCHHLREPNLVVQAEADARQRAARHWEEVLARRAAAELAAQRMAAYQPPASRPMVGSVIQSPPDPLRRVGQAHFSERHVPTPPSGPVDYAWAVTAPPAKAVDYVVATNKAIWPKWDWSGILSYGASARQAGTPVGAALTEALRRFGFSPTNNIIRTSWIQAGLLQKVRRGG
jgi:hypothetical protein